jgi:hypothetical protein
MKKSTKNRIQRLGWVLMSFQMRAINEIMGQLGSVAFAQDYCSLETCAEERHSTRRHKPALEPVSAVFPVK